ncbi:ester cyclase [Novosphingobium sp.]|uniref:ester cyclase n=1 Tax=Novosphingobium sp. TaxID=1874826 RepID=UPI003B527B59
MSISPEEAAKAIVRRNTQEVQVGGDFALFDQIFADDFVDHTPQPGAGSDKDGVRMLYTALRAAFPDLQCDIGWQSVEGDLVTTYKIYSGTHSGPFLGLEPSGHAVHFEAVDAMRVRASKITEHWGVGNLYSAVQQILQTRGSSILASPDRLI